MNEVNDNTLLDMSENGALTLLKSANIEFRITAIDGEHFIVTMDYKPLRRNLEIADGKVTSITRG